MEEQNRGDVKVPYLIYVISILYYSMAPLILLLLKQNTYLDYLDLLTLENINADVRLCANKHHFLLRINYHFQENFPENPASLLG